MATLTASTSMQSTESERNAQESSGKRMRSLKVGDRIKYYPLGHRGVTSTGHVVDIIFKDTFIEGLGYHVRASSDRPRIVIKNDNTGKEAAYQLENIVEIVE